MKRAALLFCALLPLSLAACGGGGGGGNESAFCDDLQTLSDQVADGDLADDNGLDDVLQTVNKLIDSAPEGDALDGVNDVADAVESASPDEAERTADDIQDALADVADSTCSIDADEFAVAPEVESTTTTAPDEETTTTVLAPGTTDGGGDQVEILARIDIPANLEPEFTARAQSCFNGDMPACDTLFLETPIDSIAEAYGATCGGRFDTETGGQCTDVITGPVAVPADATDTANANACFAGDMNACDVQFGNAAPGSIDQVYGALCGGRVPFTNALCVNIFGPTAFN